MSPDSGSYRIFYGILDGSDIESVALVDNENFGQRVGKYGSRPVEPDVTSRRQLEEKYGFYSKLEASIDKEGIRNPIFCQSIEQGTFGKYGLSRLWLAKRKGIKIPCIVADYVGRWNHLEELFTKEDISAKYADKPTMIDLEATYMKIAGCEQMHLDEDDRGFFYHRNGVENKMTELELAEKKKYDTVWRMPEYRRVSPGELAVDNFLEWAEPAETLVDLGCGPGRASLILSNKYKVTMLDISERCLDKPVRLALSDRLVFRQASLWNFKLPMQDYGYCCDVMEHIPEEKVDEVLDCIAASCKSAYLQIHLMKDCGKFIDEPLHLTIKPTAWWHKKILERYPDTEAVEKANGRVATFYARK